MTSEQKKGRRKFRQEILHRMRAVALRRMKIYGTNAQIDAAAKILTDRYMHAVDNMPTQVKPIEAVEAIADNYVPA